jgi:CheY-like chemotaxis protein
MMEGRIWVESEPGKGATFAFTLRAPRGGTDSPGLPDAGVDWSAVRVLVVDDDPEAVEYFAEIAGRFGIVCDAASGGEDVGAFLKRNVFHDIYFIDWKMAGINGIELTKTIRESGGGCVVAMISATEWNVIADDARDAGVERFLAKPLFPSSIADCINECLGIPCLSEASSRTEAVDSFAGRRLLLAEDVDVNREIVLALLEPTELEIDCAENGREALRMFSEHPERYDMIFMDMQMPEMDGLEATRRIRALDEPAARIVPIIAMTANVFREDVEKCLAAGMNDHVGKPLDFSDVLVKLRKYLPGE